MSKGILKRSDVILLCLLAGLAWVLPSGLWAQTESKITTESDRSPKQKAGKPDSQLVMGANLAWQAMDVVAANHVEPPARAQMILDGLKRLAPLEYRAFYPEVDRIDSPDELARLLGQLFAVAKTDSTEELDPVEIANSFLADVPGTPVLVTAYQARINQQLAENRYVGVGIALEKKEEITSITVAFRGGPAHLVGVRPGDQIIKVDGKNMIGQDLGAVVMALRGPKDSKVTMTVRQPNGKPRTYEMTRGVVPIASIKGISEKGLTDWEYGVPDNPKVAYVEISDITGSTAAELATALRKIERQGFTGLILDFRPCLRADVHQMRMVADTLISADKLGVWTDASGKATGIRVRPISQLNDRKLVVIASPAQTNEVQFLIEALMEFRKARLEGELPRQPIRIRGNVLLPSKVGTVENLYIGTAKLAREESPANQEKPGPHRPNVAQRFRTGDRKVDSAIRSAATRLTEEGS